MHGRILVVSNSEDGGQVGTMNGRPLPVPERALRSCRLTIPLRARTGQTGGARVHTSSNATSRGQCRHLKSPLENVPGR